MHTCWLIYHNKQTLCYLQCPIIYISLGDGRVCSVDTWTRFKETLYNSCPHFLLNMVRLVSTQIHRHSWILCAWHHQRFQSKHGQTREMRSYYEEQQTYTQTAFVKLHSYFYHTPDASLAICCPLCVCMYPARRWRWHAVNTQVSSKNQRPLFAAADAISSSV